MLNQVLKIQDWLKTRIANIDIFDEHYQREGVTNPFYALGPIFYMIWFIVMATGLILIMWYVPTKAAAFNSIFDIQHSIPFGGLMRGMHKYGADAMIIAATMRMYRMFILADYKPGKEFNIAIGLITLLLSMYSGLTGYLLIWNQRAFWATKVFATFPTYMDQFPVMGDFYLPLVKSLHMGWNTAEGLLGGGAAITQETITRFFSLHLAFSLVPLIFVELYFYNNPAFRRVPLNWLKRIIVTSMLIIVATILPAAQGARCNPDVTPLPILSDWYFLGLYQMYKYLEPVVATEITLVIPLSVILLPFIDVWVTGPERDINKRPLIFMLSLMGLICWVVFSFLIIAGIANIHNDPPYWRDFMYLFIDVGIIWQLSLLWLTSDVKERAKGAFGALILGIVGLIQSFWALYYFYMAKTEMFLGPLGQAFVYQFTRGFAPEKSYQIELLVKKIMPVNGDYWDFHSLLSPENLAKNPDLLGKDLLLQLQQQCQQTTVLDGIFKIIPTFTGPPHASYQGMLDYMVNNRWVFDYITFTEKMSGLLPHYPAVVPDLDKIWMICSPIVMVLGFGTWYWCKNSKMPSSSPGDASKTVSVASS